VASRRGSIGQDACHHDIDRGKGGDKVDVIDPAAAPSGTDEEACGEWTNLVERFGRRRHLGPLIICTRWSQIAPGGSCLLNDATQDRCSNEFLGFA
jgi:hypothetical protein